MAHNWPPLCYIVKKDRPHDDRMTDHTEDVDGAPYGRPSDFRMTDDDDDGEDEDDDGADGLQTEFRIATNDDNECQGERTADGDTDDDVADAATALPSELRVVYSDDDE